MRNIKGLTARNVTARCFVVILNPDEKRFHMRKTFKRILKTAGIVAGVIIAAVIAAAIFLSVWLTPARLSRLVEENAGKYLRADVRVDISGYTFWSTFPVLHIEADSLSVVSHSLRSLPDSVTSRLPASADSLFSSGKISASLDVAKALKGMIDLDGIYVGRPRVNIVLANDTAANFSIIRASGEKRRPVRVRIGKTLIEGPVQISFLDLPTSSSARLCISRASVKPPHGMSGTYAIRMDGVLAEASHAGISLPRPLPLSLDGEVDFIPAPMSVRASAFNADLGGLRSSISLDMARQEESLILNSLSTEVASSDLVKLMRYVPEEIAAGIPKTVSGMIAAGAFLPVRLTLSLDSPYRMESKDVPPFSIRIKVAGASFSIPLKGKKRIPVSDLHADAYMSIKPSDSRNSSLRVSELRFNTSGGSRMSLAADVAAPLSPSPSVTASADYRLSLPDLLSLVAESAGAPRISGSVSGHTDLACVLSRSGSLSLMSLSAKGKASAPSLAVRDSASGTALRNLRADYEIRGASTGGSLPSGKVVLRADGISLSGKSAAFRADGIKALLSARQRSQPFAAPPRPIGEYSSLRDSVIASRVRHSPLLLAPALPSAVSDLLTLVDFKADIQAESGSLSAKSYPTENRFRHLDMSATADSLLIRSLGISVDGMKGDISGNVSNIRGFLAFPETSVLNADLAAEFDNIDINRLCGAYYDGVSLTTGKPRDFHVAPVGTPTRADSLCVAVPRNISARVSLRSDSAEYMQYGFSPLSTVLSMKDGIAEIGDLSVGAPYGHALLNWTYSTSDLNDINMDLDLGIDGFDISGFLDAFPSLAAGAPQIGALHGLLDARARGSFRMFPDMTVNAPSMEATADVRGDSIRFDRDDAKIRHITHLMLIRGYSAIPLHGLDIHAAFRNNMLSVEPFTLSAGPYRVMAAGVNNLQGEIYYHAGLMDSPFHLPFGVNIVGYYRHPSVRFGGKGVKDGRERHISADLTDDVHVNIMQQLKHGWLEFVTLAAKYDAQTHVE